MGWSQAVNSIGRIVELRAFPTELPLSRSILVAPSGNCGVSALVNAHGEYDFNNMNFIKQLLRNGGNFIDAGANIGPYTLIAAEQERAKVLAIEPHPTTFEHLRRNVERNGYRNVQLVRAALGDSDGSVTITDTPGSSTTHITRTALGLEVPLRRMDTLLSEAGLTADIVKIDVEGFELAVLKGFGVRLADVKILCVEINALGGLRESPASELHSLLRSAGFQEPRFYDSRKRQLVRYPVLRGEDPLWVHASFLPTLNREHGIGFDA